MRLKIFFYSQEQYSSINLNKLNEISKTNSNKFKYIQIYSNNKYSYFDISSKVWNVVKSLF